VAKFFSSIWTSITEFIDNIGEYADEVLIALIKIIGIIILARVIFALVKRVTRRVVKNQSSRKPASTIAKKAGTVQTVTNSIAKYVIYFFAIMGILGVIGLGDVISSMLAAAGIGGIVIALGAQSLVKDIMSGMFMLFENELTVGEYVKIADFEGTVEAITLRTTTIITFKGESVTVPNGSIDTVVNYSRGGHLAIIDMPISFDTDIELAGKIMKDAGLDYMAGHDNILEEPRVLGIIEFSDSEMVLRMVMRVAPLTHWETERALRRAIKEAFDKNGVAIPYPRRIVVNK
jgi:small conductance mechanosensitive channel